MKLSNEKAPGNIQKPGGATDFTHQKGRNLVYFILFLPSFIKHNNILCP